MTDHRTARHAAPKKVRRGLASTGALSLVLAGGAFAVADMGTASAAGTTIQYKCSIPDLKINFNDPWNVNLNVGMPSTAKPNSTVPAPNITATVTTGKDASDQMRALNIKTVKGTGTADYTVGSTSRTADLTIPQKSVPSSGNLTTTASGTGKAETMPASGTVVVKAGNFTSKLTTDTGFVINLSCKTASADTTVGKIVVGSTAPTTKPTSPTTKPTTKPTSPTTKPTSPTTKPTSPTTKPTSPTGEPTSPTSTAKPTGPAQPTGSSSTTGAPVPTGGTTPPAPGKGPKVDTDYVSVKHTANMAGVAFAAAGVAALAGSVIVGRRENS